MATGLLKMGSFVYTKFKLKILIKYNVMNFPSTYKTAKLTGGVVSTEEKQFPSERLTENSLVIKPIYMGICRADAKEVSSARDIMEDRGPLFGHEIVGKTAYAGKNTSFIENKVVTFNPNITPNRTTGFAEYFFISGDSSTLKSAVIPFPDGLGINHAFVPEPFACIVHSLKVFMQNSNNSTLTDKTVGIIGAGNSGIMFGFLSKYYGAKVKLLNRGQMRIDFAKQANLFSEEELERLDNSPKYKDSFDIVIVVPTAIDQEILKIAFEIVKPGGFLHLYGGTRKNNKFLESSVNIDDIRRKELFTATEYQGKKLHISGAYGCFKEDFEEGFALYQKNLEVFPLHRLISKTISLEELPDLITSMVSGQKDFPGKVLVKN